jgi:protein-tyrosine phosphatase
MIDIHSHILPDVDDGARTMEEALEMAKIAFSDGIQQMVCTPHMFNGISDNPEPAEIVERVAAFQERIGPEGLRVLPGNEVHISHEVVMQAKTNRVTKLNRQNYMLVEFPALSVPIGCEELFYRLQLEGVRPILVHPERNSQIQANPALVASFVERGVRIQVTAMSVTGEFGPVAKTCADRLLRHNCVHFLATDTHRAERRPPILSKGRDAAAAIVGPERAQKLVYDNPLAVVNGEPFDPGPPIPFTSSAKRSKGLFGRLFGS